MKATIKQIGAALLASAAILPLAAGEEVASGNLRGFGRVQVESSSANGILRTVFKTESAANADTVLGKFLYDLGHEPDVTEKDGVFSRPGAAFALCREGNDAVVYSAQRGELLSGVGNRISSAPCPAWMRNFGWHTYGMGGFESFHEWMNVAKRKSGVDPKKDRSLLDPADDFGFLREMTADRPGAEPMPFDNWLDADGTDFAPGIVSPLWMWKRQLARRSGVPMGWRVYTGGANAVFGVTGADQALHAEHLAKPPSWLGCSMARRHRFGANDTFHDEGWNGLMARRTYDAMKAAGDGEDVSWMHPSGEIAGNPSARWHQDYGDAAQSSWREFLRSRGEDASTPIPEFATFAGLGGMVLDLAGDWLTRCEFDSQPKEKAWWRKPLEERCPGLAEKWFAEDADLSKWETISDMPGNWEYSSFYSGRNVDANTCSRWFRRNFAWDGSAGRTYLYFMPLANVRHFSAWEHKPDVKRRHHIFLNGRKVGEVGMSWGALDVTEALRKGENVVAIRLSGCIWAGRVFLSAEAPESYPFASPAKNRLWALWHEWQNESRAKSMDMIFDAMRQADPNAPIEMMAPQAIGRGLVHRLALDWGGWPHFTGEGSWFFPWNKRYGRLWGIQGSSELAGPAKNVRQMAHGTLRVFTAGLDGHKPVFLTQTYSRDPALRRWWLDRKELLSRMGTYDIDLGGPQVLLYRRSALSDAYDVFPDPYPAAPNAAGRDGEMETPWEHDWGRGTLQSLGQSFLYLDDDGILAGKIARYPLIIDCGNEVVPPAEAEALRRWVDAGGTFVALPFTGRSTPPEDAEPVRALLADKRVVVLTKEYWQGLEDEGGVWNAKPTALERVRALLAKVGFPEPVAVTDDPMLRVQPYRSNVGLDSVVCVANWHGDGGKEAEVWESITNRTVMTWRLPKKPAKIVRYAAGGKTDAAFDWDAKRGAVTISLEIPAQEVQVFSAEGVYDPGEAVAYWWGDQKLKWRELKKPTLDLERYRRGEWKDPTQDLKDGWSIPSVSQSPIPLDVLQFWGWPKGKGGILAKRFDLDDKTWTSDGGRTWLACGPRFGGVNFMTKSRLWLNGEEIGEVAEGKLRIFRDVTDLIRPAGNELRVEMQDGDGYTGLVGGVWLYHRKSPSKSIPLAGEWRGRDGKVLTVPGKSRVEDATREVLIPAEWKGRFRVRLWMEGDRDLPLGVRVNGRRFVNAHRSNFASVRDLDITDHLKFGEMNSITLGDEWNAGAKKTSVDVIRLDVFEVTRGQTGLGNR